MDGLQVAWDDDSWTAAAADRKHLGEDGSKINEPEK